MGVICTFDSLEKLIRFDFNVDSRKTPALKTKSDVRAIQTKLNNYWHMLQTNRFKHSVVSPVVGTRHQTGSAHQAGTHIANHISVEVRHHHDIKLEGLGNKLKRAISTEFVCFQFWQHTAMFYSLPISLVIQYNKHFYESIPAWWCYQQSCYQTECRGNQRPHPCSTAKTAHPPASC